MGVGENFVGGLDFGEEGGCTFDVAIVAVRVEFERFAAVGFLDPEEWQSVSRHMNRSGSWGVLIVGGCSLDAEELVITCLYFDSISRLGSPAGGL